MVTRNKIKLGVFGFGCVGEGLFNVLDNNLGFKAEIVKICVKNKEKKRNINSKYFTYDKKDILDNPGINVIVEVIDDADEAFQIAVEALTKGKAVVTANKKMIAENLQELLLLQEKYNTPILYEAACCASIPLVRNFEEYYDNDLLYSFSGIMNGTTNYILTEIFSNNKSYKEALELAQSKGYVESNPALDLEGYDSKYKLTILLTHAFGVTVKPEEIFNTGIGRLNNFDAKFAFERHCKIKLIARAQKLNNGGIAAFVMPELVNENNELYGVDNVFNGIVTESSFADKNIFIGKGAGAFPTASAVLSDISALSYDYRYEYKKKNQITNGFIDNNFLVEVFVRSADPAKIDVNKFEEIYERYYSKGENYVTGKINFDKLIKSDWADDLGVNILLLNNVITKL
ncbi:MAG: homoserine dehydrogenase [Ignavibacteriaceae bacterium]|nr:homoserine dehydrogenase [Ignavibacteriaceae bacterium]